MNSRSIGVRKLPDGRPRAGGYRFLRWLPGLVCLLFSTIGRAATIVDWLSFNASADRTRFSLLGDTGQARAEGRISLAAGVLVPLSPTGGLLQTSFWSPAPPFTDSVSGTATLTTTQVQVAPQAGAVQYQLTIEAQDLSGMIFAVGQLFGSGTSGTREVNIGTRTLSGMAIPLDFLGVHAWDNGLKFYAQPLDWDGQKLSLLPSADGESAFAFFRVQPSAVPVTQLAIVIPNGYSGSNGDALEFAFGIPVPEPGSAVILGIGVLALSFARRRAT